jgi:NAD(P)-dependent dehydrogenase (short-subunit alcohol dehydrogenase family)
MPDAPIFLVSTIDRLLMTINVMEGEMGMLDGKVAIITGGTSGIGERTVELFVQEGAKVVIAGRRADVGEEIAKRIGPTACFIRTVGQFGRLDCLVNNAGVVGPMCGIADLDLGDYDAAMSILLRGVFLGIKYAAPVMVRQGAGSIVNVASIAGHQAGYAGQVYSTAKAAVIHLSRCIAAELGENNVRVNSLSPGAILTGIFGKAFGVEDNLADRTASVLEEDFAKFQPIPRAGRPDDIARAAAWLASDASGFVNGQDLVVDGGRITGLSLSASNEFYGGISAKVTAAAS